MVVVHLGIGEDMRIECGEEGAALTMVEGVAECLGTSVAVGQRYVLPPYSTRLFFSAGGAALEVDTQHGAIPSVFREPHGISAFYGEYVHQIMASRANGPFRVLLVSPPSCGLAVTLAQLLANVCNLSGAAAQIVDLDVSGSLVLNTPGTVSSVLMDTTLGIDDALTPFQPIMFGAGDGTGARFTAAVTNLAKSCAAIGSMEHPGGKKVGGIVVTCCATDIGALCHVAQAFNVTVVFVLGVSGLADSLRPYVPVHVADLPFVGKLNYDSGRWSSARLRQYFFGASLPLLPCHLNVPLSALKVYEVDSSNTALRVVLNASNRSDYVLRQCAVLHAQREVEVPVANIAGFVVIEAITDSIVTLVCPGPPPLPSPFLLLLPTQVGPQDLIP